MRAKEPGDLAGLVRLEGHWDGGGQHHPADPVDPTVPVLKGMLISELARAIALELGLDRATAVEIESRLYDRIVTDEDHEAFVNHDGECRDHEHGPKACSCICHEDQR